MIQHDSADRRRLGEICAAHGFLRRLFDRSTFPGHEFDVALEFARNRAGATVDVPAQVIRRLLAWYQDGNPGIACRVLDAGAVSGGVLWLQAYFDRMVAGLHKGRPAVVFVTGVREALRPDGRRWSPVAEREKTEFQQLLEKRFECWSHRTETPVFLFVS